MTDDKLATEERIKETARRLFMEKGFAGTKTRDIAEAADINLALLNYYFRSKKKLFDIIMIETLQSFFLGLVKVLNNEDTSLIEKVEAFGHHYIDLLSDNPNVAPFILNTIRENPDEFVAKIGILEQAKNSVFITQFQEALIQGKVASINPIHFMLNLMGLVVFPFIAQPMVSAVTGIPKEFYYEMVQERKRLIPLWVKSMMMIH